MIIASKERKTKIDGFLTDHEEGFVLGTAIIGLIWLIWWAALFIADNPTWFPEGGVNDLAENNYSYFPWIHLGAVVVACLVYATWRALRSECPTGSWKASAQSAFDNFSPKTSVASSGLPDIWLGGLQECRRGVSSLREFKTGMNGPFESSIGSALATAKDLEKHTEATYKYLLPAMSVPSVNPALNASTEEMVRDVRLLKDLVESCSHLYVQARFATGHAEVVTNEIDRIVTQIEAAREIDEHALTVKAGA